MCLKATGRQGSTIVDLSLPGGRISSGEFCQVGFSNSSSNMCLKATGRQGSTIVDLSLPGK